MKKGLLILLLIFCSIFSSCGNFLNNLSSSEPTIYTVSNSSFTFLGFETTSIVDADLVNGTTTRTPALEIKAKSNCSLIEVYVEAYVYNENKELLGIINGETKKEIKANEEFSIVIESTGYIVYNASLMSLEFSGKSKDSQKENESFYTVKFFVNNSYTELNVKKGEKVSKPSDPNKTNYKFVGWYTDPSFTTKYDFSKVVTSNLNLYAKFENDSVVVTFVLNNGENNLTKTVETGTTFSKPSNPTKKNHLFDMWCTDSSLTKEYDFSKAVTENITLYAKYIVDYQTVTNEITKNIMKCNVKIYTKSYNTILGITSSSTVGQGSGVIFYQSSKGRYYVLTNNHVVVKNKNYDKVSYTIEDYKGNIYTAYAYDANPDYDLAVVYFDKESTILGIIEMETKNANIGETIVSVGQPEGQVNAISYGVVKEYVAGGKLNNAEAYQSNVRFDVMKHDSDTTSGSSGCAILNMNLKLVGIHYAGNSKLSYGLSIPIEKVREYLNKYIYS